MGTGAIGVGMLYQLSSIIPTESESDAGMPTLTQNSFFGFDLNLNDEIFMLQHRRNCTNVSIPMSRKVK